MAVATDPRRTPGAGEGDVRPVVAGPPASVPLWVMGIGLALLAVLLFSALEARRRAASSPPVGARDDDTVVAARSTPPLVIPPEPVPVVFAPPPPVSAPTPAPPTRLVPPPAPRTVYVPQPVPPMALPIAPQPRETAESAVILDISGDGASDSPSAPNAANSDGAANGVGINFAAGATNSASARATVMPNRPTTVVQGTLIPAVLEAAFDSTRPGPTRAVVARDVRGFDGARVLIPRGSRLFGEYRAQLQPGQNRALINWTRLIRPDGVTIAIASPAADTLGRAGVRGKVNSHFLEKFGLAILQTSLDVGANIASRSIGGNNNNSVVLALPAVGQTLTQPLGAGQQILPTMRIAQGTSISVFVARDLDFTAVERRQ